VAYRGKERILFNAIELYFGQSREFGVFFLQKSPFPIRKCLVYYIDIVYMINYAYNVLLLSL